MNALDIYLEACRKVFESDLNDQSPTAWADIYRLLSLLRQALVCCVCSNLIVVPMSSRAFKCRHVVCKVCVGQTMRLSAPCVDCNNTTAGYTEDRELRIVLMGYKRVCRYLDQAKYVMKWGSLDGGTNLTLRDIVVEGSRLADEFRLVEPTSTSLPSTSSAVPSLGASPSRSPSLAPASKPAQSTTVPAQAARVVNRTSAVAPVTKTVNGTRRAALLNGDAIAIAHERANSAPYKLIKIPKVLDLTGADSDTSECDNPSPAAAPTATLLHYSRPVTTASARRGCRCGAASLNPGKLTCCGQRCPCYVAGSSCAKCRCKGCRNPIDKITQLWGEALEVGAHESIKSGADGQPPPPRTHVVHILQVDD
ncbi:uncharacterized protein LOC144169501 [Haemaphysalis longicornis]